MGKWSHMNLKGAFQLNHDIPARWKSHVCTRFQKPGPVVTTNHSPSLLWWWRGGVGELWWPHEQKNLLSLSSNTSWTRVHILLVLARSPSPLGPLPTQRVCSISVSHGRQVTWLMTRSCCIPHNNVLEARKLLKSLITHIKAGNGVAITYMRLRICERRKPCGYNLSPLGAVGEEHILMTCGACEGNKSFLPFKKGLSLFSFQCNNSNGLCWCMSGHNVNFSPSVYLVRSHLDWKRQHGYFICNSSTCQTVCTQFSLWKWMFARFWYSASAWTHVRSPLRLWQSNENKTALSHKHAVALSGPEIVPQRDRKSPSE